MKLTISQWQEIINGTSNLPDGVVKRAENELRQEQVRYTTAEKLQYYIFKIKQMTANPTESWDIDKLQYAVNRVRNITYQLSKQVEQVQKRINNKA